MDIGISIGGFIYMFFLFYPHKIHTIDTGKCLLSKIIKKNTLTNHINTTHINNIKNHFLCPYPKIITIDVSFISLYCLFSYTLLYISTNFKYYILLKPQFEISYKLLINKKYIRKIVAVNMLYYLKYKKNKKVIVCNINKNKLEFWIIIEQL